MRLNENEPGARRGRRTSSAPRDGKLILRQVMADATCRRRSPTREKQGFSAPDASWFRGESIDYVRRTLLERPRAHLRVSSTARPRSGWSSEHLDGETNRRLLIWSLLNFEHWCRRFLKPAAAPPVVAEAVPQLA